MSTQSKDTNRALQQAGREVREYGLRLMNDPRSKHRRSVHIGSALGVSQYVELAAEVSSLLKPGDRILDWGSGWGHNSYLLKSAGLHVTSFDVRSSYAPMWPLLFGDHDQQPVIGDANGALPFADGCFDAVLSCGVLEHTPDDRVSLAELYRVLKPGGLLLIYHLPNRYSVTEGLGRMLGRIAHERRYSRSGTIALLDAAGFTVEDIRYYHWLPRNVLTNRGLGTEYGLFVRLYLALDGLLSRLWPARVFSTAWKTIARKRQSGEA